MSGICSAHQVFDPACNTCQAGLDPEVAAFRERMHKIIGDFRSGKLKPQSQRVTEAATVMRQILVDLVEWDRKYPKATIHSIDVELQIDAIIQRARTLLEGLGSDE